MLREIVFWGASGQAKVLFEAINETDVRLVALIDNRLLSSPIADVPLLAGAAGLDDWLGARSKDTKVDLYFSIAVGGSRGQDRQQLFADLLNRKLHPMTIVHPRAFVASNALLGPGSQILAQSAVAAEAKLGRSVIVNTAATPVEVNLTNSGTSKLSVDVADPSDEQFTLSDADGMPLTGSLTLDADKSVKLLAGFKPKSLGTKRATVTLRIKGTDIELGTLSMVGEGTAAKMENMGGCSVALGGAAAGSSTAGLLLSALSLIVLRRRRRS